MAMLLTADGRVEATKPANGRTFTLQELQTLVGGYLEVRRVDATHWLVMNEDGKRLKLLANIRASEILRDGPGLAPWDYVCGDVLLADMLELNGDSD